MTHPICLESFNFFPAAMDANIFKFSLNGLRETISWWLSDDKGRSQYNIGLDCFTNTSHLISSWSFLCYTPLFLLLPSTWPSLSYITCAKVYKTMKLNFKLIESNFFVFNTALSCFSFQTLNKVQPTVFFSNMHS